MKDRVREIFEGVHVELAPLGHAVTVTAWPLGQGEGTAYAFTDHVAEAPAVMRRCAANFEQAYGSSTTPEVYLAARYSRAEELKAARLDLAGLGLFVTSRWIDGGHELTPEGSAEAHATERVRFAQEDRRDLYAAQWVIAFTEAPRETKTRGGRHVELGMALALGKRVYVVGPRENVFCCLPEIQHFDAWPDCLAAITAELAGLTVAQLSRP